LAHFSDLAVPPKIIAPDVSTPGVVADYLGSVDIARIDAIAHHLYGSSASSTDVSRFYQLGQVGKSMGRPLFQTEMQADGFGTALLLHHTLVTEGAAAYLHIALVGPPITSTFDSGALITIDNGEFTVQPAYHALRHYALHTDPGWVRVDAATNQEALLASAWLSPANDALTIVLVNAGVDPLDAEIGIDEATIASSRVTRTSFDGIERSADLGTLPRERVLRLPGHSLATVTLNL
jgi:O-glycosyl hydrolase